MTRTVVAIEKPKLSDMVCAAMERSGISVRMRCRTGAEAIRAVKKMGGGVIICSSRLPDMSANELWEFLEDEAFVLVVAKPQYLSDLDGGINSLPLPAKCTILSHEIERLVALDDRRAKDKIPARTDADRDIIERAKALIIKKDGLSETAAHRYLQRRSMETCMPMTQTARSILEKYGQ